MKPYIILLAALLVGPAFASNPVLPKNIPFQVVPTPAPKTAPKTYVLTVRMYIHWQHDELALMYATEQDPKKRAVIDSQMRQLVGMLLVLTPADLDRPYTGTL